MDREELKKILKMYVDYEYIDFQTRSGAHKGTEMWLNEVADFLLSQKDERYDRTN